MYFPLSIHLPLLLNLENVITAHKQSGIFNGRNNLSQFFIRHIKDHFVTYTHLSEDQFLPKFKSNQYRFIELLFGRKWASLRYSTQNRL